MRQRKDHDFAGGGLISANRTAMTELYFDDFLGGAENLFALFSADIEIKSAAVFVEFDQSDLGGKVRIVENSDDSTVRRRIDITVAAFGDICRAPATVSSSTPQVPP